MAASFVFDVVREVFVRVVDVDVFNVLLLLCLTAVMLVPDDDLAGPRKSVCSVNTVAAEHVVVERTASFTDSTEESGSRVVTAIGAGAEMS